jgi:acyl-CoA dehydrogenase
MTDIEYAPEHAELRAALRRYATDVLEPFAEEIDRTGDVPPALIESLREQGYLGLRLPVEFGGSGLGMFEYCLVLEEFARVHRVITSLVQSTSGLSPRAIARSGSPEQKEKYLHKMASGHMFAAFALTEPEAGSDPASMRTSAKKVENGWAINGTKHFISWGDTADVVVVIAVTDADKRARGGITAFLVDRGTPGFNVSRVDTTMGSEAIKLAELTFTDCVVPDDAVLGVVGEGFKVAMASLDEGRMGVSCSSIGVADRLLEMAIRHASTRKTFGKLLNERQAVQWMLVDSAVELASARAMSYEVLRRLEAREKVGTAASMCKLSASEMVGRVADRAVQIHGGMGLIRGFPVERFYRDTRHFRVGEGASEIQRMVIARSLFKDGAVGGEGA